jgi:two-component system sensor histidine kinase/response regulator
MNGIMAEITSKERILLVEDLIDNIQLVKSILEKQGYDVLTASNSKEALQLGISELPSLMLLDINIPGSDGFSVAKQLKDYEDTKHIPIIFLTSRNDVDDIQRGFESGGVDYLTKPFNPTELVLRIKNQLDLVKSRKKLEEQNRTLIELQQEMTRDAQKLILLNEKLADSEENLSNSNAAKDKFFSILSHDLRSPLAGLLGLTELINNYADNFSRDDLARYGKDVHKAAKNIHKLLENLLEWSHLQTGKIRFEPENINFSEIVFNAFELLRQNAGNKKINIENKFPEGIEINADPNMLNSIIRNLISNAIKFTEPGGKINIDFDSSDGYYKLTVTDNGVGMKEEDLKKLFKIDEQQSKIGTSKEKGSGLGLILVKEFVDRHGGNISVTSSFGEGSSFTVALPSTIQN